MKSKKKLYIAALALLLLVVDQLIKFYIKLNFPYGGGFNLFGEADWAQILFIENNGMAFGLQLGGMAGKLILSIFRLVLISLLIWYIKIEIYLDMETLLQRLHVSFKMELQMVILDKILDLFHVID